MVENALTESDQTTVIDMVTPAVRNAILKTYAENPEYQSMSEFDLERICQPSVNATLIRAAFWDEYRRAIDTGRKMVTAKIYDGCMSANGFFKFIDVAKNTAWMMCPPADEFLQMRADTYKARQEYSKILRMPLVVNGKLDFNAFKATVKIYEMYSNRIHGSVIQRIEKKTQRVPSFDISGNPEELREELEKRRYENGIVVDLQALRDSED